MVLLGQQTFPPNAIPTSYAIAIHVGLLLLVLTAFVGTFWLQRRRPHWSHLVLWVACFAAAATLGAYYEGPDSTQAFVTGYVVTVFVLAFANVSITSLGLLFGWQHCSRNGLASLAVAGLGFAVFMLLPATPQVREAALRTDCKNRIKTIALAMHNWADEHAGRLPDLNAASPAQPPRSWRVELLPYMDIEGLRKQYVDSATWSSEANLPVARHSMPDLACPSVTRSENQQDTAGRRHTHFLAVTGPDTVFAGGRGLTLDEISKADGAARTLMIVEAVGLNVVWTEPRDADTAVQPIGFNLPSKTVFDSPGLGSAYHPAGVNLSFADATVYTVPKNIDPAILKALTTVHGNDPAERGF